MHVIDHSDSIFNYDYQVVKLSDAEFEFLQACDAKSTVAEILTNVQLDLDEIRKIQQKQLIILSK